MALNELKYGEEKMVWVIDIWRCLNWFQVKKRNPIKVAFNHHYSRATQFTWEKKTERKKNCVRLLEMNIYEPYIHGATFVTIQHLYDCKSITSTFQFISIRGFFFLFIVNKWDFLFGAHKQRWLRRRRRKKKRKQHYCFKTKFILEMKRERKRKNAIVPWM